MKLSRGLFEFENPPRVLSFAAIGGKKESEMNNTPQRNIELHH